MLLAHKFGSETRKKQIEYLMRKKLPYIPFDHAGEPIFSQTSVNVEYQKNLFTSYLDELKAKTDDDLKKLHDQERELDREAYIEKSKQDDEEFLRIHRAGLDCFEHYSKFEDLTLEEVIALLTE